MTPADLLVSIAGYGLHPSSLPIINRPLGKEIWQGLLAALTGELVLGLAVQAADSGALPVTGEQHEELSEHLEVAHERRSAADRCLDEVVGALDQKGIQTCLMHGAASAALDYRQRDLRLYDTLHLLVGPDQREEAVSVLVEQGILRPDAAKRRLRRQSVTSYYSRDGVRVVLYTALAPKRVGAQVEAGDLFHDRVAFTPRTVTISALGREERLIAACVHARLNVFRKDLLAQRDVVQLVLREDVSVRKIERQASSWRLEAVLADAVRSAWEMFRVPDVVPISAWSRSFQPDPRARRRLAAHPLPGLEA